MIIRLIYFYDNLNKVVILAPGSESFSAKCAQFPLTSYGMYICPSDLLLFIFEINLMKK